MKLALPLPSRPTVPTQDGGLGAPVLLPKWQLVNRSLAGAPIPSAEDLPAAQEAVQHSTWAASLNQRVLADALTGQP